MQYQLSQPSPVGSTPSGVTVDRDLVVVLLDLISLLADTRMALSGVIDSAEMPDWAKRAVMERMVAMDKADTALMSKLRALVDRIA